LTRRAILLISAIIVAALGTTLVFLYVSKANDRALANQNPVRVLVAKSQISPGTTIDQAAAAGALEERSMPKASVVQGALSDVVAIKGEVALTTIYPGQQIVTTLFGATAAAAGTSDLAIPQGDIALSMQFGDPARVAGFVQPGSHVAVFLTASGTASGSNTNGNDFTRILLPDALIVAVGPTTITPPQNGAAVNPEQLPRAILTLALPQRDAQKLVYGSTKGALYLGLLDDKSKISRGTVTSLANLFK
jgi:pilus assembly protein CpaB